MNTEQSVQEQQVHLTIQFDGLWFWGDTPVTLTLDGVSVGEGSMRNGFCYQSQTNTGQHTLTMAIHIRPLKFVRRFLSAFIPDKRLKTYVLAFPKPGAYSIRLSYDRFWGKFQDGYELTFTG